MTEEVRVAVRDLLRQFSQFSDICLTRPVIITKNGRDRLALISIEEYNVYRDLIEGGAAPADVAGNRRIK